MTIKHAYGETVIKQKPVRIVTLDWDADYLVALGVVPVATGVFTADGGNSPWMDEALAKLGVEAPPATASNYESEIDYEAILAAKPDLILNGTMRPFDTGDDNVAYKRLNQIAPTIRSVQDKQMAWRETTRFIGKIVDKNAEAERLIADMEAQLKKARENYPTLQGFDFVRVDLSAEKAWFWTGESLSASISQEFGMTFSPELTDVPPDGGWRAISLEQLDQVKTSLVITRATPEVLSNKLIAQWEPIAKGNYVSWRDGARLMAFIYPNPLNISWMIDHSLPDLKKAAAGGRVDVGPGS